MLFWCNQRTVSLAYIAGLASSAWEPVGFTAQRLQILAQGFSPRLYTQVDLSEPRSRFNRTAQAFRPGLWSLTASRYGSFAADMDLCIEIRTERAKITRWEP
jgi:hypothetical protein